MFEKIHALIRRYDRIILHRHAHPDGDAIGSQVGLKHLILENFPGKTVLCVGDPAGRYAFLPDSVMDDVGDEAFAGALSIILDTSGHGLISDSRYRLAEATARIDHHLFLEKIAEEEVVDPSFESCCGLIAAMAEEMGWRVPDSAALLLYAGMVTDSGRFRYDCTSARTFGLASYLVNAGIDMNSVYLDLYASDLSSVLLRAEFVKKIKLYENSSVAYIYNTREEIEKLNIDDFSVSRGMVNVMADIKGIDIWVNFTEVKDKVWCELRSSKYNINPIAVKYGGGGHQKASGADVADFAQAMEMLSDLKKLTENT